MAAEETEAAKQAKKEEIENHFKAIHEAYEVLINHIRRRIYDSTNEFDDEIPPECDENTLIKEVDSFYSFWYRFKRWREFPHADEFNLEQAESRDYKRWMERLNVKLSEKARKEESAREEETTRIAEEKKKCKKDKEAPVSSQHLLGLTDDDVEGLCMSLDIEQLRNLCDKVDGKGELVVAELLREALGHEHNSKYENKDENSKPRQYGSLQSKRTGPLMSSDKREKPWSKEEIDLFRKGMLKYPKRTSRRWEAISEYIGTARTVEDPEGYNNSCAPEA
ncbi:hypothetical protein HAX54_040814 [Datura stramonium]|uniref:Myb-like domain-containing protein n=1 Tax=Datura stramonium TaxID=4076 RepID=A0ABS8SLP3_DATST|nr:hypothetical protein [Datura stramonium]